METKICLNDAVLKIDDKSLVIQRDNGFLSIGNSTIGCGIKTVKSIINYGREFGEDTQILSKNEEEKFLHDFIKDNIVFEPVAGMMGFYKIKNSANVTIDNITAIVSADYEKTNSMNIIVIVNEKLDEQTLLELFKAVVEAKSAALWDYGVINHFSFDPLSGGRDSILVACAGTRENRLKIEKDECELQNMVEKCVREAAGVALRNCGFPKNVLDFMKDVGVEVEDLVEVGMELLVGVKKSEELEIKLHNQILKSLEDLNVVSFIIAGIRLEEDYEKHRVKGVNVDDDPAYLYSDEVMGMAVANQIAGTKAIFNFKRYDEAKPGVIGILGPVLDDVFAGLVAGCMSKIFEE